MGAVKSRLPRLALSLAVTLMSAAFSPAVAEPCPDLPSDHWALGAIAVLAARGIIEGYPDGPDTGDRGVTRCDVARIVATIPARIGAIEEELTALDQSMEPNVTASPTKVPPGTPPGAPSAPLASPPDFEKPADKRLDRYSLSTIVEVEYEPPTAPAGAPTVTSKYKLYFTGAVAPTMTAVALLGVPDAWSIPPGTATFDYAYVDLTNLLGGSWQIGIAPFILGPTSLLFDEDPTAGHVRVDLPVGGLNLTAVAVREDMPAAPDALLAFRTSARVADVGVGICYLSEPSLTGTRSHAWAADFKTELRPGVNLKGAYAAFASAGGPPGTAYETSLEFDLAGVRGLQAWSPSLKLGYREADPIFIAAPPTHTAAASWRGWSTELSLTLSPSLAADITLESGIKIATGLKRHGLEVDLTITLPADTELTIGYSLVFVGGVEDKNSIEVALNHTYRW